MTHKLKRPSEAEMDRFFAARSPLSVLPDGGAGFRSDMLASGREAGKEFLQQPSLDGTVLVVARPRDFEGFASGLVEELELSGRPVRIACLWLHTSRSRSVEAPAIAQVMRWFIEDGHAEARHIIVASTVLDRPATVVTGALWAAHRVPGASFTIASDLADEDRLASTLAELRTCFRKEPQHIALRVEGRSCEFDEKNVFSLVAETDDQVHEPPFVTQRMRLQAERRLAVIPRPELPKPPTPGV